MAQQAKEVPDSQMMPMAKKFIKNMLANENGLDKRKFAKLKNQPDKQQKIIQKWMEDHALDKKSKSDFMGTGTVTEYYLGSKKINTEKAAKEVHAFLKEKSKKKEKLKQLQLPLKQPKDLKKITDGPAKGLQILLQSFIQKFFKKQLKRPCN